MTIYNVYYQTDDGVKYIEEFHSLSEAKKRMKQYKGSVGTITKVWANGEWEPMGKIDIKGCNKTFAANSKMKKSNY